MAKSAFGQRRPAPWWRNLAVSAALFALIAGALALGSGGAARYADSERLSTARAALRRAVVTCYAVEGFYPPNVEYLYENYGVEIDTGRYFVYYDAFASNLFPDIDVFQRGEVGP